ncbi:zf-HC2 domain-containing protein [Nocardioides guangzhouensis]|uniref:Zf-HC2 domain-containing protein n=1 Tax=Nocardioides guangzhouensis TaxID=2497878 RepID=A0A4Q4ZM30_9ACTN|nr:zf-HC2 domain-containing protein [Nocardioides guangzhouensis]RYP88596.1 zf-HC2 domain-containing protein [Nocardioides guangzhouensis]
MSCPFAHDDAAYVLGALSPTERLAFERHLDRCDDCTRAVRELAGLPGLLGRVDASVLEGPTGDVPLPDTLLPRLSRELRADRRRRRTRIGIALAGAAAAVIVPVVAWQVVGSNPESPTPGVGAGPAGAAAQRMSPVGEVPVRARLSMEQVTWGTRLGLTCTYEPESVEYPLPSEVDYTLFVRTRDGKSERVGSWRSVDGRTMHLTAGTATNRDDIASVEVRTTDGRVVLVLAA